jgi:Leucine-rich repeat (LRR) protein
MTGLVELVLDKNQIKTADPNSFPSLINLRNLSLRENRIKSLAHFDCLPNLQRLHLSNNRIHEIFEIERMKLPSLIEITMDSMAITKKQMYRILLMVQFPQIRIIDGGEVCKDEKLRAEVIY